MAPRANWNAQPKTDHRLHRELVDSETGKSVALEVKDYATGRGDFLIFEPDETACKPGLNNANSVCAIPSLMVACR